LRNQIGTRNFDAIFYAPLKQDIEHDFPILKDLFLIDGGNNDDFGPEFAETSGHIVFEEKVCPDSGNPSTYSPWIANGKAVVANRLSNIPRDDWERDTGEPFVSILPAKLL
jgi:hypothetical protein